jgi:uncharacterized protein (DUF1800 family)
MDRTLLAETPALNETRSFVFCECVLVMLRFGALLVGLVRAISCECVLVLLRFGALRRDHSIITSKPKTRRMANDAITSSIAHLYRRAGFGITMDQANSLSAAGYSAAVEHLLDRTKPDAGVASVPEPQLTLASYAPDETVEERKAKTKLRSEQSETLVLWWLQRMTVAENPLVEKMSLFWHAHFATSTDKVRESQFMYQQNQLFRQRGLDTFEPLVQAVAKDPAMMIWLDSNQNRKGSPNENFARELMELFTLGIGNYSDVDVREAARAFSGWRISKTGVFSLQNGQVDSATKTILGKSQNFSGEQVVNLFATNPSTARFVTSKIWSRFAFPVAPDSPIVAQIAPAFAADGNITNLMRAVFSHPEFVSPQARTGLVKQPIEYVVGALRAVGIAPYDTSVTGPSLRAALYQLNQAPFDPPSVGGWPQNYYWLSTATTLSRSRFALALAKRANLSFLTGTTPEQRADQLAQRLGLDAWTASSRRAVVTANSPIEQVATALIAPEYVLN